MRSDRAKYASNDLWRGTPEENKETADGTITYFGTYSINEADIHDIPPTVKTLIDRIMADAHELIRQRLEAMIAPDA